MRENLTYEEYIKLSHYCPYGSFRKCWVADKKRKYDRKRDK